MTDDTGQYRLGNLPPGTYVVTAQLPGFAVARRENIDVRAGANFQVDFVLVLGSLEETVLVTGEPPMIETQLPTNVLNVDGEFQRSLPLLEGKNVVDVMGITPVCSDGWRQRPRAPSTLPLPRTRTITSRSSRGSMRPRSTTRPSIASV